MEVSGYQSKLLCELNEQRKRDFFCDCSIVVEGRVFKAHRNVLFAGSGYFRALLVHYLQDSGQHHSTASLDIVTAEAFSSILDFLYSGRLDLRSDNVIEVMSAASYLQMTDVVSFCKGYIRSSLEICNREKERDRNKEKERDGPADSGTPAMPPPSSTASVAVTLPSLSLEGDGVTHVRSESPPSTVTDPPSSAAALPRVPTPPGPSRDSESDCSSRGEFPSHIIVGRTPHGHGDHVMNPLSSGLTLELVRPKIEYDPDDEPEEGSPDTKDLTLFMGPPLHTHHPDHLHDRLASSSPSPSSERSSLGFGGCHARQFMDVLLRGGSSPHRDRGEQGQMFAQGMGLWGGGGRVDEGLGMGGSSIMEIQSDWYGEDTGDGLLVPVKLHKCPFCPYTAKQKGILKRHIRCHTGERPFPCETCGKRFTRQEHLRSHSLSVHRSSWPVVCKGCRRSFTGALSHGLKRFGLCDNCTCVTTTGHDDSPPAHINLDGQPEAMERGDGDSDWPRFRDDADDMEDGGGIIEDLGEKGKPHGRLSEIPSTVDMKERRQGKEEFNFQTQF
ncbi:zinc finger and BTB domain-containing protein 8B [Oncorhynchus clarkii lewisi]|uniref:zinc finger and BTB domain-containing protein 8B n=1 Tax=Oncorhynchus clarkii lewisi TaxID=490388 RepID=UPI0039B901CD